MGYIEDLRREVGHRALITCGSAVVIRRAGEDSVLLQERHDGRWGLPGGLMELGESLEETARREVLEETGLRLGDLRLLGVFSGPSFHSVLPNGDEIYTVTAVYEAQAYEGIPRPDGKESRSLAFWPLHALPDRLRGGTTHFLACVRLPHSPVRGDGPDEGIGPGPAGTRRD